MKLNLGCGQNKLDGYVNVDKHGEPDVLIDLEHFPWCPLVPASTRFPVLYLNDQALADNCADEVVLNHVLEHLGATPDVFIGVMKELYRVCKPGALVHINVPHPRHDHFIGDPTHVRVVTPEVLSLFSKTNCERWAEAGAANSPLAMYHDVDFEMRKTVMKLDGKWAEMHDKGEITAIKLTQAMQDHNNVVREIRMVLEVIKPVQSIEVTTFGDARKQFIEVPQRADAGGAQ